MIQFNEKDTTMTAALPNDFSSASGPSPRLVPAPIRNPLTLALLWLSKTNPQLTPLCSRWAQNTQAAFGVFVIFTAALAFGSVYYTLSTLNVSRSVSEINLAKLLRAG